MNKEIKFRFWDKSKNEMLLPSDNRKINLPQHDYKEEDIKVMQFTGLKDKNGKESADGDLIKTVTGRIYEVKRRWYSMGDFSVYGYEDIKNDEIIGNIHENKKLIK